MDKQCEEAWQKHKEKQVANAGIHGWYIKPTEFYARKNY